MPAFTAVAMYVLALFVRCPVLFGQEAKSKPVAVLKPCVITPAEREEIKNKIDALLKEAESEYKNVSVEALHDLVQLGCKLDQADIDRIAVFMRSKSAEEVQTGSYRDGHCTVYTYGKWAAVALIRLQSTFVTKELRAEASRATRSVRVTDPGWV